MKPTLPPRIRPALIDLIAGNIETFLQTERLGGNNCWFTGEEIAAKLAVPRTLAMTFNYAFGQLRFDRIEIDDVAGAIRHRP